MKKASLSIIVAIPILWGWSLSANAAQPCTEEPDQELAKTKLLPIVSDKASLQQLSGKLVVVFGRYQRIVQTEPIMVSHRGRQDLSRFEAKPIPIEDLQVHPTDEGFANIVLADGMVLRIEPRGRRSLRSKQELVKYDGKQVSIRGDVRWSPGSLDEAEISIANLRIVCSVPNSQSTMMNSAKWQGEKLDVVKTKADSLKFIDRRVQLVGKYVVKIWNPGINSNTAEFKGTYKQASIELADGTLIPVIQPYNKLSLRSDAEVETYGEKLVKVVGYIKLQPDAPTSKSSSQSVMLTSLDEISLK
jgi:hypothetical protein